MATSNKLDILNNNVPYSWLNFFKISCTQCLFEFSCFAKDKIFHLPVLLSCSHVACEYCVGRTQPKFYKCRKCNESTHFDVTRDFRLQTTFNQYLYGVLTFKKHQIPYRQNIIPKPKQVIRLQNTQECFECNSTVHLKFCVVCEVIYCAACFTSIHQSAKALKNHRYTVPDSNNKGGLVDTTTSFCKIHYNERLSFYCKDCDEICCMKCSNGDHPNHEATSVRDENLKHKHMLEGVIGLISAAQKENEVSKLKLQDFYTCHDKYLTDSIEKIANQFIYLHGLLQNIELDYINTVKESYKDIQDEINIVEATLSENEILLNKNSDKLHSYKVETPKHEYILWELQKIEKSIYNLPVAVNFKDLSINPISFKEVRSLKEEIKSYFQLDFKKNIFEKFSKNIMGTTSQMMCDLTQIENDNSEECATITTSISQQSSRTTNILNHHFNKNISVNSSKILVKPKLKVTSELVHVSHIKSAEHFYVQNQAFLAQSEHFLETCNLEGESSSPADNIVLNQMYLVAKPNENLYYRGVVTSYNEKNKYFTVFFVDYGCTEQIVKSKGIREISQYLKKHPKAARLCSLYNILVDDKNISEQVQLMSDIIKGQQMTMVTLYTKNGTNYVDLINNNENKISLRDALLFCDVIKSNKEAIALEKVKNLDDYKREFIYSKSPKKIFQNIFKIGEYFKVIIKHIVSPAEFYAMKAEHVEMIEKMNQELNEFCRKSPNFIYYPQLLMNCAVYGPFNLWHRGLITNILPNHKIEVKLIDLGIKQTVNRQNLMYLDHSFFSISEGIIKCQLSNVQPQKEDNYAFSENIIQKFKDLSLSTNLHLNVNKIVGDNLVVILHIIQANQEHCVNDLLTGNDSKNNQDEVTKYGGLSKKSVDMALKSDSNPKVENENQGIKRSKINILNVCSPSEIYICLDKFLPGLKKLHINIQKYMETNKNNIKTKPDWNQNEKCFVNTKLDKNFKKQWYRGIIQSVDANDKGKFVIFLRDKGCFVTEHFKHITETNDLLGNIGCGSILCSLSSVRPTGGNTNWPSFAIDEFRDLVNSFQEHALTLYGEKLEIGMRKCYKIILWGLSIECEDALSPAEIQWNNINMILADAGLCHLTQKFTDIEKYLEIETENIANDINIYLDNFEKQLSQISALPNALSTKLNTAENIDYYQYNESYFSETFTPIDNWPKCEPIKKSQFVAIPTYVDNDAVIYLHEYDSRSTIDRIKKMINEKYKNSTSDAATSTWEIGQSCIAKYHMDSLYYRAKIINKLNENLLQIEFVDYGNIEECSPSDLRRNVILGNVPIQAHKYCLKDIEPITPIWTTQILDIIHAKVVLKICNVRTNLQSYEDEELDVVPCQISVDAMDLSKFLVSQKFAHFKNENTKPTLIYERFLSHRYQDTVYNCSNLNKVERSIQGSQATLMNDSSSDVVIIDSDDCNESDNEEILSFDDSNFETSTQYFQMYEFSPFKMAEIQRDVHGFNGTVKKIVSCTEIIIATKFDKLLTKYKEMMNTLQLKALSCEPVIDISIGLSCIAWNKIDNLWHRGLIKSYNRANELFTVLLVDKMDMIKVKSNQIKKCPSGCQNYPLLYLRVILNKVKPNRRLRETDISNELSALLIEKNFYVKIIRIKSQIPYIELYNDNRCEGLVYQSVIDGNFLTFN